MAYPECGPCMNKQCLNCLGLCSCSECKDKHSHKIPNKANIKIWKEMINNG